MYETLWRNKWLTAEAQSIDDMIDMLSGAVDELKAMRDDGVKLESVDSVGDDYAFLVTEDAEIAKKYGMEEQEKFDEEEDCEEDCDEE